MEIDLEALDMTRFVIDLGGLNLNVEGNSPLWPAIVGVAAILLVAVGVPLLLLLLWRQRVRRRGYPGLKSYLRETPRTDGQKLEAVEMTLKGIVICLLGVFFPLAVLIGLVPLYYGARKVSMFMLGGGAPQSGIEGGPTD
jgi:hypothetical protein